MVIAFMFVITNIMVMLQKDREFFADKFGQSQLPAPIIAPLTGALGGKDTAFSEVYSPGHYGMKSHLHNSGRKDVLVPEDKQKTNIASHLSRFNVSLYGPYREDDDVFRDTNSYAGSGEALEFKVPISSAKNST